MPYGIFLLPDSRTCERFAGYARTMACGHTAIMSVDATVNRPHVSLLHVDAERDEAAELWRRARAALPPEVPVSLSGLQVAPILQGDYYVPQGGVYAGLEALRLPALAHAHHEVLDLAARLSLRSLSPAGEHYRPHVTLSVLETAENVTLPVPSAELLTTFTGRPAWGELGPYGTFPEVVDVVRAGVR